MTQVRSGSPINRLRDFIADVAWTRDIQASKSDVRSHVERRLLLEGMVEEWNERFQSFRSAKRSIVSNGIDHLYACAASDNLIELFHAPSIGDRPPDRPSESRLLIWRPRRRASQVALLGSAIKSDPSKHTNALLAFRDALRKIPTELEWLIHPSTSFGRLSAVSASLFRRRHRAVITPGKTERFLDWIGRIPTLIDPLAEDSMSVFVSPVLDGRLPYSKNHTRGTIDALLASLASSVWIVSSRPGGTIDSLLKSSRANDSKCSGRFIVVDSRNSPRCSSERSHVEIGSPPDSILNQEEPKSRLPDYETLIHWTRSQPGPWPDQSEANYWIEMLWSSPWIDRSALASLRRIVQTKKLIATNRLTRGSTGVVCFSSIEPFELPAKTVYRTHLRRSDFVPFGVCVRKSALIELGAKPVQYGDAEDWERISESDRPFYQQKLSKNRRGQSIDWSQEQEWRMLGNLNLNQLSRDDVQLFVPTELIAQELRKDCPWRVFGIT